MTNRSAHLPILLVFGLLTSGVGCQVLPIPSYRADSGWPTSYDSAGYNSAGYDSAGYDSANCHSASYPPSSAGGYHTAYLGAAASESENYDGSCATDCPPGFFPPMQLWQGAGVPVPGWWAKWRAQRELPDPAPYPRFHPLPTRPMFQPLTQPPQLNTDPAFGLHAPPVATSANNYGHLAE